MREKKILIVGGAGFIGSHFTDRLLSMPTVQKVTIYDNFTSGKRWHFEHHAKDSRLEVVEADVKDLKRLTEAMKGHDLVIHLASNPDIARAAIEPSVDFWEGTYLTNHVVEAMRQTGTRRILYASGSGVYGDLGEVHAHEDYSPMEPISTYGASKLAGEALICSYCHMFDLSACVFRFANVVGPRQTHGVGYDFVRRLSQDPTHLKILGDGTQSKAYIHVDDVVSGVLLANERSTDKFKPYNLATPDYITVKEIADTAVEVLKLTPGSVGYEFGPGNRGWKGDVPVVRMNAERISTLGWKCQRTARQAIRDSIQAMLSEVKGK